MDSSPKTVKRPTENLGLRHVALFVADLEACVDFYTRIVGMEIEWQPDDNNVYLTSGSDNLALHRWQGDAMPAAQVLDHIGFVLPSMEAVDQWQAFFLAEGVKVVKPAKTHRDGARSFYCRDPAGTLIQMIFHPPISNKR
ncbi:MAG: VOC family protein [Pseudomonadales bacterium]|nr:VOC family protein [Pseudomonadales bacterium]